MAQGSCPAIDLHGRFCDDATPAVAGAQHGLSKAAQSCWLVTAPDQRANEEYPSCSRVGIVNQFGRFVIVSRGSPSVATSCRPLGAIVAKAIAIRVILCFDLR